jgi:intergrase/recombinase
MLLQQHIVSYPQATKSPALLKKLSTLNQQVINSLSNQQNTNYIGCWKELANWSKEEFGLKDMEKIDGETVRSFLEQKIEEGKSYSHFDNYCAAFGALENALKSFTTEVRQEDRDFRIRTVINAIRSEAKSELKTFEGTRNYADPQKLISELSGSAALVAKIQLESGCRITEASKLTSSQLKGMTTDKFTGKDIGQFVFHGKGGKFNIGNLPHW